MGRRRAPLASKLRVCRRCCLPAAPLLRCAVKLVCIMLSDAGTIRGMNSHFSAWLRDAAAARLMQHLRRCEARLSPSAFQQRSRSIDATCVHAIRFCCLNALHVARLHRGTRDDVSPSHLSLFCLAESLFAANQECTTPQWTHACRRNAAHQARWSSGDLHYPFRQLLLQCDNLTLPLIVEAAQLCVHRDFAFPVSQTVQLDCIVAEHPFV